MRLSAMCWLVLSVALASPVLVHATEPIKIGAVLSISGPAAYYGDGQAKTLKMECERINREGGILGRQLHLFAYDDGSDTKQAVSFAHRLIDQDRVDVLIGGTMTSSTLAIVPIAQEAEIPLLSLGSSAAIVEPLRKWIFKIPFSDRLAVTKVLMDMEKRGIKKIGMVGGSIGFDESCRKAARNVAPGYGIKIVDDETWAQTDTDMTPQFTRLRAHSEIQAVLDCGSQASTVIAVRSYERLGMKLPHYFTNSIGTPDFLGAAGAAAEGVRLAAAAMLIAEQLPDSDPQKGIALAYRRLYEEVYHKPVSIYGGSAHDALQVYLAAVKKAGSTDKSEVRNAIEQVKNVVGVNGVFNMSPSDHSGLTPDNMHMIEVRDGKWKLLY